MPSLFKSNVRNTLKKEFISSIKHNFGRKSITSASKWAEKYRIIKGKRWSFYDFPWLKGMHDSEASANCGEKSAQMGFTETVLNLCFYHVDVNHKDVLYVLPSSKPDASDFSASRFDEAVENSPHLTELFDDVKNVGHKRAGNSNVYIRGAKSRSQLKSIPVGVVILDEINEMPRDNIPLALERLSGQEEKLSWMISTPTLEDEGIDIFYKISSQNYFYVRCPSCSRYIDFVFPDSIEICGETAEDPRVKDSFLKCRKCKAKLPQETKREWLQDSLWKESYSDRDIKGWHINQLYSTRISPPDIARFYFQSLSDASFEQEFYNSKLGINHEVEGARLTDAVINKTKASYTQVLRSTHSSIVTMGVDVGYPLIHYEIDEWKLPNYMANDINLASRPKVIKHGTVRDIEELDLLMRDFYIRYCVIDAHPERRKAYEFATRFWGHVRLAFYATGVTGKQIHISNEDEPTLSVDRTSWLDLSIGRFKTGTISLPADVGLDYCDHLKALVRIYKRDKMGNPVGSYVNTKADHYAHARNYAEIALPLAISQASSQSMGNVL